MIPFLKKLTTENSGKTGILDGSWEVNIVVPTSISLSAVR